ncbi:MAG: glutathione S-transferase family protein [Leptospiraceae bacterium]|nr:glutathione S-transferase family protein [Leptospiraceae bacterium]
MVPPELISFKLCPFVQRSVITLKHKGVPFDVKYIDLENKPDWFLRLSPTGKVPVLKVGDTVLFESAVINEYLNEVNPPSMHPADPLERARHRAWIELGSDLLGEQYRWMIGDQATFEKAEAALASKLSRLEAEVRGPFFAGGSPCLVDAAVAPLLHRFEILARHTGRDPLSGHGPLEIWRDEILTWPALRESVVPDFEPLLVDYTRAKSGALAGLLR